MTEDLQQLRTQIDAIDMEILKTLAKRCDLVKRVANLKAQMNVPLDNEEVDLAKLEKYTQVAESTGVEVDFIQNIFEEIFWNARQLQKGIL